MRILILAGTGFVGAATAEWLTREHDVAVFHRGLDCKGLPTARHIHGDRRFLAEHVPEFRAFRPDVVLDMIPQNADDALRTVQAVRGLTPRVVGVSSGSVYRAFGVLFGTEPDPVDNRPSREDSPLRRRLLPYRGPVPRAPNDPHRWLDDYDKITAERVLLGQTDVAGCVVRLPMIYGPGDPDGRVDAYLAPMRAGRPVIPLRKSAAQWRNSRAYVDNAAAAVALVTTAGVPSGVYNVAEPEDFTEGEWIKRIACAVGWHGEIRLTPDSDPRGAPLPEAPSHANYAQHLRMATERIRRELGYTESFDVDAALERTIIPF